ncbi:MAG TPA: hypothetical protein DCZ72_08350 [Armatimonadetes bacterium]|nr:hypothetical protein [Armatimonadota bacterium]
MKKTTMGLLAAAAAVWLAGCAQPADPNADVPPIAMPGGSDTTPAPPMPADDKTAPAGDSAAAVESGPVSDPNQLVGKLPPAFALKDMAGTEVSLESLRGKPVILDFWATWCPPCRELSPALEKIHREYGDRITVVGLSDEDRELVKSFTEKNDLTMEQLHLTDEVSRSYGITGIPTTVFIDAKGVVHEVEVGLSMGDQYESLKTKVEALLAA